MNDDELLAQLAAAMERTDPPPDRLRDAAIRAMAWDTGVAELSLVAIGADAGRPELRGGDVEDLSFGDENRTIDLTIEREDDSVRIFGAVDPVAVELSALEPGRSPRSIDLDDAGRFEFDASALGSFVLTVKDASGTWRTPIIDPGDIAPESESDDDGSDV